MRPSNALFVLLAGIGLTIAASYAQDNSAFSRQLKYALEKIGEHRYELALGTLDELRSQAAGSQVVMVDYYRAAAYKDSGDFAKAHQAISTCLAEGGRTSSVYFLAGEIEEGLGNVASAKTFYTAAGHSPVYSSNSAKVAVASLTRAAQLKASDNDRTYHSLGRWDPGRMPIRVYIDDGNGLIGYEPSLREDAINAFESWSKASDGKLKFTYVPKGKAEGRDVRDDWKRGAKDPGRDIHMHWRPVLPFKDKEPLGVTYPHTTSGGKIPIIAYADIYMATNEDATGKTYSSGASSVLTAEQKDQHQHQLQFVLIHEVGHALGLDHSNLRSDIMYPTVFGALSSRFANAPSLHDNDKRAIVAVYSGATSEEPDNFNSSLVTFRAQVNPTTINAYKAAYDQYKSGHYNNAVSYIESALKTTPEDPNLHFLLAGCFVKQGRNSQAREELQKVNQLSPSTQLSAQAKTLLESMK